MLSNIKVNDFQMVGSRFLENIAKAVYNIIFEHFEGSSFLENIRA